ncbi:MAG: Uma2 family endonuclease [Leptolyngbyaceae cyanobacterium bins.349]|nr:Uma2 family endonuclease [Leptolyngbyaceae cyanobacterium bins.349]
MMPPLFLNIPPLENGDRLTRHEFERRYNAMPKVKKAELIEGRVYMASPVRQVNHGRPHAHIMGWLFAYCAATPGVDLGDNATVRLDLDNEPQPDGLLRLEPAAGGQSRIDADGYIQGAPELIVEVAASSASYDLDEKLRVYRRNGVQEYLVWQVSDRRIDWFSLQDGDYKRLEPNSTGVVQSLVFPGLWLAVPMLLLGELASVLAALQTGLQTPDHQTFVTQLQTCMATENHDPLTR